MSAHPVSPLDLDPYLGSTSLKDICRSPDVALWPVPLYVFDRLGQPVDVLAVAYWEVPNEE